MQLASLTLTLALMLPTVALAETRYGSFLYDDGLPNSLFLTGEIRQGDSFELRKALRDHEIRIVIMGSAGGNLYEGLQMGSILRDKGISTYVPPGVNCESSCANMFFGGSNRKADGQLGVHQFYSSDAERSAPLGVAEQSTQYTMADVIGIMNDLDTPPFVYEKMLGTTEMHYFSEDEKRRLDINPLEPEFLDHVVSLLVLDAVGVTPENRSLALGTVYPDVVAGFSIWCRADFYHSAGPGGPCQIVASQRAIRPNNQDNALQAKLAVREGLRQDGHRLRRHAGCRTLPKADGSGKPGKPNGERTALHVRSSALGHDGPGRHST
jgi:hypothetical protein